MQIAREGVLQHYRQDGESFTWEVCDATLYASHLGLRWRNSDGQEQVHNMVLALCTDVKSLPARRYGNASTDSDLHIFMMDFDGLHERFATNTVTERAAWVNAIWPVDQ